MELRRRASVGGRAVVAVSLLLCMGAVSAGEQSLSVLNQATREVKRFEFGTAPFRVDVSFVPGWSYCLGRPVKNFRFTGIDTKRVEMWCHTRGGAAVAVSCVASSASPSVTIQQLYAEGYKYIAEEDRVDTKGAAELTISCGVD
jgi:hypothetical protein